MEGRPPLDVHVKMIMPKNPRSFDVRLFYDTIVHDPAASAAGSPGSGGSGSAGSAAGRLFRGIPQASFPDFLISTFHLYGNDFCRRCTKRQLGGLASRTFVKAALVGRAIDFTSNVPEEEARRASGVFE